MKWFLMFLWFSFSSFFLFLPEQSLALTPDEHALQVLSKDLPRTLRWFEKTSETASPSSTLLNDLYRSALPSPQQNWQNGISIRGSIERIVVFIEASRQMPSVQAGPAELLRAQEHVLQILQLFKERIDAVKFGENPDDLLLKWGAIGLADFPEFARELTWVLKQTQQLLVLPASSVPQTEAVSLDGTFKAADDGAAPDEFDGTVSNLDSMQSFEVQRFLSYIESSEQGRVATECLSARMWATDSAPRCESDFLLECDRKYAVQCKKLH